MYEKFYKLSERPFSLLPDPDFLFLSDKHRTGLDMLELAVFNQSGFCVVSGEIGAGKTTLIRELLNRLDDSIRTGLVSNTHASFGVLMQWIMAAYDMRCDTDDRVELHRLFIDFVIQQYAAGKHTLLIIDEAQNLSLDAMEELRMLSNVNTEKDLVLQVILVGQGELQEKLQRPELRQFMQRIAINYHLTGLNREETAAYIRHRVTHAGGSSHLFDASACDAVFHYTGGIPRLINRICDLGLVYGYSEASPVINATLISAVAGEHWPGEFPELPEEIERCSTHGVVARDSADPVEPAVPLSASSVSDDSLEADLRPVRRPSVVQASDDVDSPLAVKTPPDTADELMHWQSPLDDDAPLPRERGWLRAIAWMVLIAVGSGAGVLWMKQDNRLLPSDNQKQLAAESENARIRQEGLEAAHAEQERREQVQRQEAERELEQQRQQERLTRQREEAARLAREQQQARQREAEQLAREQEQVRQREAELLAREQERARQREADRRAREAEREVREQELVRQREADRRERELARLKEAEQREQQRLARERKRAEELRLDKERRERLAEDARRRAAARAALEQMSKEISWADDEL